MPIGMPVCVSEAACLSALKNHSKKSLILLADVEVESRKRQVLPAPRMPNAKVGHLPIRQGKEQVNAHGTAQEGTLRMDERPSATPHQLRLPLEEGLRPMSPATAYVGMAEAARLEPSRSVTSDDIAPIVPFRDRFSHELAPQGAGDAEKEDHGISQVSVSPNLWYKCEPPILRQFAPCKPHVVHPLYSETHRSLI